MESVALWYTKKSRRCILYNGDSFILKGYLSNCNLTTAANTKASFRGTNTSMITSNGVHLLSLTRFFSAKWLLASFHSFWMLFMAFSIIKIKPYIFKCAVNSEALIPKKDKIKLKLNINITIFFYYISPSVCLGALQRYYFFNIYEHFWWYFLTVVRFFSSPSLSRRSTCQQKDQTSNHSFMVEILEGFII